MEELNNTEYRQVYNAEEDETLIGRVQVVICMLMQRGLFIAGFDGHNNLLTIHYTGLSKYKQVWDLDFFEHLFASELLLAAKEKVKAVFISGDKNMIIPDELFDEETAKKWLGQIHFTEATDVVTTYAIPDAKARYVLAAPVSIIELIRINFKKAAVLPLPLYYFPNSRQQSIYLQCCLGNGQISATLHNYGQLLWHKVSTYTSAEDIAFEVKHLCLENNLSPSKLKVVVNAASTAEYEVINELTQYYPGLRAGDGSAIQDHWHPAISLAKQLLACA